ncbi:ATP-binding protein [Halovenus rubra]|uniref:ATP-binding protein n=2 Tax=Halovenus rubra TaxID=869890 RepID=A0ACC7DY52_9EURY|nr:ATP-binding protein [Halovenus rubra]
MNARLQSDLERQPAQTETISILVVDDEQDYVDITATHIQRQQKDVTVSTVEDSRTAITRLEETEVDCIISVYDMTPLTGIELLRKVREDYGDLPFILLTAKGSEDLASQAISAGVSDYYQKGFGNDYYEKLANRVTSLVKKRREKQGTASRRTFFDNAPFAAIEWDSQLDAVQLNETAREILGYSSTEFEGCSLKQIVPESERDTVQKIVGNLLAEKGTQTHKTEIVTNNGKRISCQWRSRACTDESGEIVAIYSQFHALSEYEELKLKNQKLNRLVSVVSHDLRNPVQSLSLSLAAVEQNGADEENIGRCRRSLDRIEALIDDLLTIGKQDGDLNTQLIGLETLVDECRENIEVGPATVICTTELKIMADPGRALQLLENLISNAIKHGADSGIIRIGTIENGFYVEDDGPGIPPEKRDTVFEYGYSRTTTGTGFGLTIVQEVAKDHGWDVVLTESKEGGARFEILDVETAEQS